jgi:hypothetical protein
MSELVDQMSELGDEVVSRPQEEGESNQSSHQPILCQKQC